MTHDHDRGLAFDLKTLNRRGLLGLLGGAGAAVLVGCATGDSSSSSTPSGSATTGSATSAGTCEVIPEETAGPYPGDGSNGPNVLQEEGIVRSDIRSSFGSASGTAAGVPLTISLTMVDTATDCAPLAGAAVYLWHCDIDGRYSLYSEGVTEENYLRGVQESDAAGKVSFTSIFPAAYSGRWPHVHFEVYSSLADATGGKDPIITSQLAFPEDVCETVYATGGYDESVRNLADTSLDTDMVFSDGHESQLATVAGDVSSGYAAALTVAV